MGNGNHHPSAREARCSGHSAAIKVFNSPVKVFAGGFTPRTPIPIGATVLDLHGGLHSPITGHPMLESQVIKINWPDMSIPAIDRDGWLRVARVLSNLRRPLFVGCGAGHGRTGTALVIIGCLLGQIPKKADPVVWIRDHYCENAVETTSQIKYIEAITLRSSAAKPSHGSGNWSSQTSWERRDEPKWEEPRGGARSSGPYGGGTVNYPATQPKPNFDRMFPKGEERRATPVEHLNDPELNPNSTLNRL
jgi:hypothetical protein